MICCLQLDQMQIIQIICKMPSSKKKFIDIKNHYRYMQAFQWEAGNHTCLPPHMPEKFEVCI